MTDEDARRLVKATLIELGLDVSSPERIIQVQHDFAYLREQRFLSEKVGLGIRLFVVTSFITAALTAIWLGIQVAIKKGGG